ncbi:globin-coupled sensor protein [Acidocella sp. C78]|uniref:globin-coupled sensor protein n=1 Tax=Acidocella sp. C78 TaxID=1671486 RepID=UPI00191BAE90|nr:globin-coupled sensor protein [Acidocella sp. C78]
MTSNSRQAIAQRLEFIGLDERVRERLRTLKPVLAGAVSGALADFYERLARSPEASAFFSGQASIDTAQTRQNGHWTRIADALFDDDYVDAVTRVGEVHARIGLEPRWYIAGYALILERIVAGVLEARTAKPAGLFGRRTARAADPAADLGALIKATFLDMDLAIAVYLDALDTRRRAVEEKAAATSEAVMGALGSALAALAAGDLSYRMTETLPDQYARLADDFNDALARLDESFGGVKRSTGEINGGVDEIARAAEDLARRTEQQAATLEQTTAALNEITNGVKQTAENAARANEAAQSANGAADKSRVIVGDAVAAMRQIEASSREIDQIIGLIDEVAFQTNLLALNAGVEAARAGDAGRGFAVVASEVRALAHRSADAAKSIKQLIARSSKQVGEGVRLVGETGTALEMITENVIALDRLITEISDSAARQARSLSEVNAAAGQMNQAVQQNAAMVEQTAAATVSLKDETARLAGRAAGFHTREDGFAMPAAVEAPVAPAARKPRARRLPIPA